MPGDSFINRLIPISHDIFHLFDSYDSFEVQRVFLDISKAFDRVCHKGLLYKLKNYGISGDLLDLLKWFLSNRKQKTLLSHERVRNIKNVELT